jgi:mono/diheme cytochrome c family protein
VGRTLRWGGTALAILVVLLGAVLGTLHGRGKSWLARAPQVPVAAIPIPADEATLARGRHVTEAFALCVACHERDLRGKVIIDQMPLGRLVATNLTRGKGGIGGSMTDEDWIRAIRHGVGHDGRVLAIMPSSAYARLSDEDLGAVIAYVKSVPPVDHELPPRDIRFPGTIFLGVLGRGSQPVSRIDHEGVRTVAAPPPGATAEYGSYLANACRECHGERLAGLTDPHGPPPGPNLTPGGALGSWTEEQFVSTIRTGHTPEGKALDVENMPWPWIATLKDDELHALWLFLRSLPPREPGDNG